MTAANGEPQPNKPEPVDKLSWLDLLSLYKGHIGVLYKIRAGLRHVGTIAVVGGVLLALIQVYVGLDPRTGLWVQIFLGIAVVGALLRIEAAIRDRYRR
ncbi:hypothetical protein [Nonomuraea jiangxiensis]|uniref:Uncharacterized protein n=1 Tax=Nonomuraea jiangxiensis TaxID=633440 RepID=A0A1G8UKA2_9ACTN|nr:hypothetical protein [Nonomuraea jiangxiensis]SDJ53917.1 hypothetical protein SAMN05421869_1118 [Nonomuraea jiangxiensis]